MLLLSISRKSECFLTAARHVTTVGTKCATEMLSAFLCVWGWRHFSWPFALIRSHDYSSLKIVNVLTRGVTVLPVFTLHCVFQYKVWMFIEDVPILWKGRKMGHDPEIRYFDMCLIIRAWCVMKAVRACTPWWGVLGLMVAASHSAIINLGLWGSDIVCAQYN